MNQPKPLIIGIAGYARTGKTTAATILEREGVFAHLSFAEPIRRFATEVFKTFDPDFDLERDKELRYTLSGYGPLTTPRGFMQLMGTEFGRKMIDPDLWVKLALARASRYLDSGVSVVISDVRFPNEAHAIRNAGGVVIWLNRPGCGAAEHASEQGLPADLIDFIVHNDADIPRLRKGILSLAYDAAIWKRLYQPLAGDVEQPAVVDRAPGYPVSTDEE